MQVRLLATSFTAAGTAAGPSIRQFLAQPAAKRQRTAEGSGSGGSSAAPPGRHTGSGGAAAQPSAQQAAVVPAISQPTPQWKSSAASQADLGDVLEHSYGSASPVSTLTPPDEDASELVSAPPSQPQQLQAPTQGGSRGSVGHPPPAMPAEAAAPEDRCGQRSGTVTDIRQAPASHASGSDGVGDVDLAAVDIAEQRRILRQLEAERKRPAAAPGRGGKGAAVQPKGGGARQRQRGIAEAFQRQRTKR